MLYINQGNPVAVLSEYRLRLTSRSCIESVSIYGSLEFLRQHPCDVYVAEVKGHPLFSHGLNLLVGKVVDPLLGGAKVLFGLRSLLCGGSR